MGKLTFLQAQTDGSKSKIEAPTLSKKELRKQAPKYFGIALGLNSSNFIDFATSPLTYNGIALQPSISLTKIGVQRESDLGFSYDFGLYLNRFNKNTTTSKVKRVELNYSQLYRVGLLKSETYSTKVGFLLSGNGDVRINPSLQNNALGIDIFANLLGSIKITKDISRKVEKEKKFLFLKYKLNERKQNVAFRLNLGLINSSYRNGSFVYSGQSAILNDTKILDDYVYKIFSGFRASSSLDYTRYLKNKNAIRFSYVWDAYSTGGDFNRFEMAHHILKFNFLFNTNNK